MIYGMPERLKNLRLSKRYTQKMVAERIRSNQSEISKYESGEKSPSLMTLIALAYAYECTLDYLVGKSDKRL